MARRNMSKKPKGRKGAKAKKAGNVVRFRKEPQFSGQSVGLPARKMVQMRYCEHVSIVSTVGALNSYEWSANDLYDPNITGGGHQPYGFDQWTPLYQKFTVMKSEAHIEVASNGGPMVYGLTFARSQASSTITTAASLLESYRGTGGLVTGSSAPVKTAKSNFDLKVTDPDFDPGSFFCTSAASPTFRYHYGVFAQSADLSSTITLLALIIITYDVLLEDPVTVAAS